jgi:hypothetical protein
MFLYTLHLGRRRLFQLRRIAPRTSTSCRTKTTKKQRPQELKADNAPSLLTPLHGTVLAHADTFSPVLSLVWLPPG